MHAWDGLLFELSNATGDILENVVLIENLENTKKTARQINKSMAEAKETTIVIAKNRLVYSTVCACTFVCPFFMQFFTFCLWQLAFF